MPVRPNQAMCRILYFRCRFENDALILQDLLHRALNRRRGSSTHAIDWRLRLQNLHADDDDGECLLVNHLRGYSRLNTNNIFGDLCRYRPGGRLATILEQDDFAELQVNLLSPREKQQFLNGMIFWLISGNDVILVQSRTLRYRSLEEYLRWFLVEATQVLPANENFRFEQSIRIRRTNPAVRAFSLSAHVPSPASMLRQGKDIREPMARGHFGSSMLEALRAIFHDDKRLQRLMDKIPEGEDVSVEISIKLPSARRVADPIRLEDVTAAVHALHDANIKADTDTGPITVGDLLQKPEFRMLVDSHKGIWDRDDIYRAFGRAWAHFRDGGFLAT